MSLKMALVGVQIKHFKSALQCLGRIGPELLIEALPEKLILRSINTARSAFVAITFRNEYFDAFDIYDTVILQAGVLIKQMSAVFRTQRIFKIIFELISATNTLQAVLVCDNGMHKEYKVMCIDAEVLQAMVDKDAMPVIATAEASELSRLLSSFQTNLEEITIIAWPTDGNGADAVTKAVQLKSYNDPSRGASSARPDKAIQTQLKVDTREAFQEYSNATESATDITFNLKDFRHMLALAEGLGANIALLFDRPGHPLIVEPRSRRLDSQILPFDAELVLATLMDSQLTAADAASGTTVRRFRGQQNGREGSPHVPSPWTNEVGGQDLPAPRHRPADPQSAGPSRFGSESVRRDLGNMSVFRDQQLPGAWPGPGAAKGHAQPPSHGHEPEDNGVQINDGAVDDYADLPPVSGSAQQHARQRPLCPSGLRDDGYMPSLHGQETGQPSGAFRQDQAQHWHREAAARASGPDNFGQRDADAAPGTARGRQSALHTASDMPDSGGNVHLIHEQEELTRSAQHGLGQNRGNPASVRSLSASRRRRLDEFDEDADSDDDDDVVHGTPPA